MADDDMVEVARFSNRVVVTKKYLLLKGHYGRDLFTSIGGGGRAMSVFDTVYYKFMQYFQPPLEHNLCVELKSITSVQHTTYTNPYFMLTFGEILTLGTALTLAAKLAITFFVSFTTSAQQDIGGWQEVERDVSSTAVIYVVMLAQMFFFREDIAASWLNFLSYRSPLTIIVGMLIIVMIIGTGIVGTFIATNPNPMEMAYYPNPAEWFCSPGNTPESVAKQTLDKVMCKGYDGAGFKCPSQDQPNTLCDSHIKLPARAPWVTSIIALGLWVLGNIVLFLYNRLRYPKKTYLSVFITTRLGYAVVNWEVEGETTLDTSALYAAIQAYPHCLHTS